MFADLRQLIASSGGKELVQVTFFWIEANDVCDGGDAFARWLTDYLLAIHQANW
jgi:hypothetical protein